MRMNMRRWAKDFVCQLLSLVAVSSYNVKVILMYHSVGSGKSLGPLDVSLDAFRLQMDYLR
jgi:hypothetical protein